MKINSVREGPGQEECLRQNHPADGDKDTQLRKVTGQGTAQDSQELDPWMIHQRMTSVLVR